MPSRCQLANLGFKCALLLHLFIQLLALLLLSRFQSGALILEKPLPDFFFGVGHVLLRLLLPGHIQVLGLAALAQFTLLRLLMVLFDQAL